MSIDRPVFLVEVKVAEGWQLVGSAPMRDAAATLAAAAVRRISTEGDTYTQVRIYIAMGVDLGVTRPGVRTVQARRKWVAADGSMSRRLPPEPLYNTTSRAAACGMRGRIPWRWRTCSSPVPVAGRNRGGMREDVRRCGLGRRPQLLVAGRPEWGLLVDDPGRSELAAELRELGVRAELVEADLADPVAPARLYDELEARLGPFTALVASHCRDVELPLLGTSAEEFDTHFAVNARSVALLIQELANRLPGDDGRIVVFTTMPYLTTSRTV